MFMAGRNISATKLAMCSTRILGCCAIGGQAVGAAAALCKKYGVKVYFDIMPRHMANAEFKRRILEMYSYGAENIGLWDTNTRAEYRAMWSTVRNIGHKDALADMYVGEGENYRNFVIYSIGGKDFSRYDPVWGG
jgi:hypothetical protein